VERFFRDITVYLRDGSFSSIRELESSITTFLALRNAQPSRLATFGTLREKIF
ncbi:ISPsy25, transposase, partial [Pseudomonas syringae pv. actinidiae ICMP 19099]